MSEMDNALSAMANSVAGVRIHLADDAIMHRIERAAARHIRSDDTVRATMAEVQRVLAEYEQAIRDLSVPAQGPITEYTSPESVWSCDA